MSYYCICGSEPCFAFPTPYKYISTYISTSRSPGTALCTAVSSTRISSWTLLVSVVVHWHRRVAFTSYRFLTCTYDVAIDCFFGEFLYILTASLSWYIYIYSRATPLRYRLKMKQCGGQADEMDSLSLRSKHCPPYNVAGRTARAQYVRRRPEVGMSMLLVFFQVAWY